MAEELSQKRALRLTVTEGEQLKRRLSRSMFLANRGIEVYLVPCEEPMVMADGVTMAPSVLVMVRAETDMRCGMGVGFVTAISEGLI